MSVYRVSGIVQAPDGSEYEPEYWGSFDSCQTVLAAIYDGAADRGEGVSVQLDTGPGTPIMLGSAEVNQYERN